MPSARESLLLPQSLIYILYIYILTVLWTELSSLFFLGDVDGASKRGDGVAYFLD